MEIKHRHILEVARALRFQSELPINFWGECVLNATYIINRLPTKILQIKPPTIFFLKENPTTNNFVFLVAWYMLRIIKVKTNLVKGGDPVFLLGILVDKKGIEFLI